MEDVNISKYRAQVVRAGSTPASPGFVVSEGQNPVDPSGSGQNHLPVTIATAATGLSITESQVLGGAGTVGQYIRGDGSLADFPATTGGGSSVSYYLNGSVSQGTIGGVAYKELNRTPVFGAGTDISINADGYIASFITDALDPNKLLIPGGNWNFETYFSASSSGGSPSFYVELYKYDGTTFTLLATSSSAPELIAFGTNLNPYFSTLAVPETVLALTDRLAVRFYVTHSGRTITLHTENGHLCQVITTFTTGLTALNGLTSQVQFFAVGTSGTDFAISSASDTHTFNLPTATSTIRGALSSADWSTFNGKQNALTLTTTGTSGAATLVGSTLNIPQYQAAGTYVTAVTASSPLASSGGTTPNITIQQASGSQSGFLSSTDWTTFNNKQNALTNPVTGTGTTNYLPKFTGSTTIGNSQIIDNGTQVGVGLTPNASYGTFQIKAPAGVYSLDLVGRTAGLNGESQITFWNAAQSSALAYLTNTGSNLYIGTGANQPFTLSSGGNFIFGSTTDAGFKLDVNGTGRFTSSVTSAGVISSSTVRPSSNYAADLGTSSVRWADIFGFSLNVASSVTSQVNNISADGAGVVLQGYVDNILRIAVRGSGYNSGARGGLLASTADFSSSVTAASLSLSGTIASGGDAATLTIKQASTTFTNGIYLERAGERNGYYMYIGGGLDALTFRRNYFGTQSDVMSLTRDGNVGIGTDAPTFYGSSYRTLEFNAPSFPVFNMSSGGTRQLSIISSSTESLLGTFSNTPLRFYTNSSPQMSITSGGNVLIGTTTDSGAKLYVTGALVSTMLTLRSNNGLSTNLNFTSESPGGGSDNYTINHTMVHGSGGGYRIEHNVTSRWIRMIAGSGGVELSGGATSWASISDLRLKNIIGNLENSLDSINSLSAIKYTLKTDLTNKQRVGLIAQEVQKVLPECVEVDEKGMLSVRYTELIPLLVSAIKELNDKIK